MDTSHGTLYNAFMKFVHLCYLLCTCRSISLISVNLSLRSMGSCSITAMKYRTLNSWCLSYKRLLFSLTIYRQYTTFHGQVMMYLVKFKINRCAQLSGTIITLQVVLHNMPLTVLQSHLVMLSHTSRIIVVEWYGLWHEGPVFNSKLHILGVQHELYQLSDDCSTVETLRNNY